MNPVELLHNAARQYCVEQSARWHRAYAELIAAGRERTTIRAGNWSYTTEAYAIFPRYQVLAAIQSDIERFVPDDFKTVDELRSLLFVAGETAQNSFTEFENPTAVGAVEDERRRFVEFIRGANEGQLKVVPMLPFRRVLGEIEHRKLYEAFEHRWGRWYGGWADPAESAAETATLHTAAMDEPEAYNNLRHLLAGRGVTRLFELREWGDGYEIETAHATFFYTGAEGFWTSGDMEWMVYASHESSITFGAPWLVEGMRSYLPLFDKYMYRSWDLAAYENPID